jgi:hypothetical protein
VRAEVRRVLENGATFEDLRRRAVPRPKPRRAEQPWMARRVDYLRRSGNIAQLNEEVERGLIVRSALK